MSLFSKVREGIQQKSQNLSESLAERRRQRIGEELAREEARLKRLTEELEQREKAVGEREAKLNRVYLLPKRYVQVPLGLVIVAGASWAAYSFGPFLAGEAPSSAQAAPAATSTDVKIPSYSTCLQMGIAYFKEIGSFPYLSSGEDAGKSAEARCGRSPLAFGQEK